MPLGFCHVCNFTCPPHPPARPKRFGGRRPGLKATLSPSDGEKEGSYEIRYAKRVPPAAAPCPSDPPLSAQRPVGALGKEKRCRPGGALLPGPAAAEPIPRLLGSLQG